MLDDLGGEVVSLEQLEGLARTGISTVLLVDWVDVRCDE